MGLFAPFSMCRRPPYGMPCNSSSQVHFSALLNPHRTSSEGFVPSPPSSCCKYRQLTWACSASCS